MHPANRGRRLRAFSQTLRYEIVTVGFKRPISVPLGSRSKIIAYPGETNSPHAVFRNPPNWPEMSVWQRRLQPGDLFVDVGGNIGVYTILAQDLGARTITFEPDSHNCQRIQEHLALNGYTGTVHNKAVSNAAGVVRITQGLDSYNHLVLDLGEGVDVEAVTLDSVLGDSDVAGLKIDVEGAERLVLEGAVRALEAHRVALIQMEWTAGTVGRLLDQTRAPVEALLREAGYELYRPDPQGRLQKQHGAVAMGRDVFAAPAGSLQA